MAQWDTQGPRNIQLKISCPTPFKAIYVLQFTAARKTDFKMDCSNEFTPS